MVYKPSAGREFYDDQYEDDDDQVLNNRLVFPKDKVYGRTKELEILTDLFDQLYDNNDTEDEDEDEEDSDSESRSSPVVAIQAPSGTGKSAMICSFIKQLEETEQKTNKYNSLHVRYTTVCHMRGRFERTCTDPFSAILEGLNDFFDRLLQNEDTRNLVRIRSAIVDSLASETLSISALVPRLGDILKTTNDEKEIRNRAMIMGANPNGVLRPRRSISASNSEENDSDAADIPGQNSRNRIRYLFNALFCAICNEQYPLIMFLDDCQWADDESLGLIESLIKDPACRYFMFIGNATRGITEAKEDETNFAKLMTKIEGPNQRVTRINLLNLSIDEIGEFIADTLQLTIDECRPLTEIIYGKTRGNIFFSIQAIEELQRRNILYFSMIVFRWEWNLAGVEFQNALSDLSDDVGTYVSSKIQSLPKKLQRALVIASHTKTTFDVETLEALMIEDGCDIDFKELNGLLDLAVLLGLLTNTIGTGLYQFANDRVQQATYWVVSSSQERAKLRVMIGRKLYELYFQPKGKEWMLFVAADHLNSCIGHGGKDDLSLAKLNLQCGKKARFLGAYVPASLYMRLALSYLRKLDKNPWESHYDLSLQIYREISDSELCLGKFEKGEELAQIVLNETRNLEDKLPTYLALAEAKGKQQKHAESFSLCHQALVRVGAIPKHMHYFHVKKDSNVIKRFFKSHSDYDILMMPICYDKKNNMVMDLLSQASRRAHHCGNMTEYRFCIARQLRLTFEFGFSRTSAQAFASYGKLLQDSDNDVKNALRMAGLAREIMAKTDEISSSMKSETLFVVGYWIEAWSYPREHVMETLQEAHSAGMAKGNIEIGFQCIVFCNIIAQSSGYPLEPVEKTGAQLIQQLSLYNVESVLTYLMASRVSVLCLMGKRKIDWNELEPPEDVGRGESDYYTTVFSLISRLELGVLFGNIEFAVRMSESISSLVGFERSYICGSKELFYSGLAYLELARKTGSKKYERKAMKFIKTLRYFCRTRGLNALHKCLLLEAEVLSLECHDVQKLTKAYDEAIIAAVKIGYTQDAAHGSELTGAVMKALNEDDLADQYLNQACKLWKEYGAHVKVRQLSLQRNPSATEEHEPSVSFRSNFLNSKDISKSCAAVDLELLVGIEMKKDIKFDASKSDLSFQRS